MSRHLELTVVASLVLGACVTSPLSGDEVSSTTKPIHFDGFGLAGGRSVSVEASASASGPFVAIAGATALTSARPTRTLAYEGGSISLYGFALDTVVPARRWHSVSSGCTTKETFVRVRDGAVSYLSFDSESAGIDCIDSELADGALLGDAITTCRSAESPVIRIKRGGSTHVGDVVIDDAADLAALSCVDTIEGSLTISGSAPNLVSLPALERVTGDVNLTYTSYLPDPHPGVGAWPAVRCGATSYVTAEVRVIDLPALATVEGNLALTQQGSFSGPSSTQAIDLGLNALSSLGGDLSITVSQFGGTPCGLSALTSLPGDFTLQFLTGGEVELSITKLLPGVTDVAGTVTTIGGHNSSGSPLVALTHAGGLHIVKTPGLSGFKFPALSSVTGTVELEGTGFASTPTALTQAGALIVRNSGYSSLEHVGGATLAVGSLTLEDNASLSLLTSGGTSKVTLAASGSFTVAGNPLLAAAQVCSFVAYESSLGWTGPRDLDGVSCP